MSSYLKVLLFSLPLFFFFSCKNKKEQAKINNPKDEKSTLAISHPLLDSVLAHEIKYHSFAFRANCDFTSTKQQVSFNASVRILKDSLIWISLTGPFSIEGARVLLTPDSFKLNNNLSGEKLRLPFSELKNYTGVSLSFYDFENMLSGKILLKNFNQISLDSLSDETTLLKMDNAKTANKLRVFPQNYTVQQSVFTDLLNGNFLQVNFENYEQQSSALVALVRNILLKQGNDTAQLNMELSKIRINEELHFPF